MNKRQWTEEEDNYLKSNFGKYTFSQLAQHFGCTIKTVQNRAEVLGIKFEKGKKIRWTEEEVALLKEMSTKYLNKTIAKKLGKSVQEINKKARALGIKLIFNRPVWKKWMINYLKDNINMISISQLMKELDVSYYHISMKIAELGLQLKNDKWSEEEEKLLIELSSKCYIREIAKVLNRTETAIVTKARKMGLEYITTSRKYTQEELDYIKDNWGIVPVNEIARNLKVSHTMIYKQADLMYLPKLGNNPYRKWTDENIKLLKKMAEIKTIEELAKYFKTTNEAISTVAYHNNIELIDDKVRWTDEDNKLLKEYSKTMDLSQIALKMNRNTSSVRMQALRQGITIKKNNTVWTEENSLELKKLVEQNKTLLEITKIMNKRDVTVLKKAKELGLNIMTDDIKDWTAEEIQKFILLCKTKKISELVNEFNRSTPQIIEQAKKLGIKLIYDRKSWTEEEYQLLEQLVMVQKKSPKEIASILGRTEDAIIVKLNRRGLKIQTNDKRFWTKEEEEILTDLWGIESVDKIAKKLNRTVSSVKNKVYLLGLGSQIENNYDGLKLQDICDIFNVSKETVNIYWVSLGLKYKTRNISKVKSYRYVEIKDLYDFLEKNQNIWDSRLLEKNILGKEPEWLKLKRENDKEKPIDEFKIKKLIKQQLINEKKYFLEQETRDDVVTEEDKGFCKKLKL